MALGEDFVLLAVNPRSGMIRNVERIAPALRALELIELTLAGRVTMEAGRIVVEDPTPIGYRLLDHTLRALSDSRPPTLQVWLRGNPAEHGILGQYLALLGRQQVIRIEQRGQGLARTTRIAIRDEERYARARARIDRAAYDEASATAEDRAVACVIHVCGLGRPLYRGPHRVLARRRLARYADQRKVAAEITAEVTETVRAAKAAADTELANAVAEALSSGIAKMTRELTTVLRQEYRLDYYNSHHTYGGGGHHHSPADTGSHHSGHHHMGSGDVGGGHHPHA